MFSATECCIFCVCLHLCHINLFTNKRTILPSPRLFTHSLTHFQTQVHRDSVCLSVRLEQLLHACWLAQTHTHTGWTTVWLRTVCLRLAGLQGRPFRKWRVRAFVCVSLHFTEGFQTSTDSYWHSKRGQESSFASPQPGRLTLLCPSSPVQGLH